MIYFLDTNICIHYMRKGTVAKLIEEKILQQGLSNIKLSAIVAAELLHGAYHSKKVNENLNDTMNFLENFEVIPLGFSDAEIYGQIRASLERKGNAIGTNDMFIAASALLRNATLVTNNTKEFSRIDGLIIEDWTI